MKPVKRNRYRNDIRNDEFESDFFKKNYLRVLSAFVKFKKNKIREKVINNFNSQIV